MKRVLKPPTPTEVICPIRGHDHTLAICQVITQLGTGNVAWIYECPEGKYRWFMLEGEPFKDELRMIRPRWGWKE